MIEEEKVEEKELKFEAKWEEVPEKVWKRVFQYCCFNDGSVPFLVRYVFTISFRHQNIIYMHICSIKKQKILVTI